MGIVKKTASIVSSLIIILAISGFVFVRSFDLNRYKGYIEDLVLRETGRKLTLNGDAEIGLSLVPTLVINDVTFANPDWAQNPYMAKLDKLEVQFSLKALLHKQINIKKFILVNPEVYLETSVDGRKSWELSSSGAVVNDIKNNGAQSVPQVKDARAAAAIGIIAKEVKLENGQINFYDAKTKKNIAAIINEIEFEAQNDEPMLISIDGEYDKQKIEAEFELSNIQEIIQSGNIGFTGEIEAWGLKVGLNGTANDITGDVTYSVEMDVHNPAGNFSVPETSLLSRIDGNMNNADVNIRSLNVANNLITGNIKADWTKNKPYIEADLRSDVFNVKTLTKNSIWSFEVPNLINEAQALSMVPNDKIPYQYLNKVNGIANLKIGKLILPDSLVLMDIVANAKLNNGFLNVNKFNASVFGGKFAATGNINAAKQSLTTNLSVENLRISDFYKTAFKDNNLQVLDGGLLDVDAKLSTDGATYRKYSENLSGQFTLLAGKSTIKTGKLDWLTEGVLKELFKLLKVDAATNTKMQVECAVINGTMKGGKAEFNKSLVFSSDKLKLVGSGNINLVNDKIDFTLSPTLNKLASGNFAQALASFIRLKGTLQNPSITLDKTSAVSTVVGTMATSGLYLGSEVLLSGDDNLCNTALKGTKFITRYPRKESVQTNVKDTYQDVAEQARDAAKEIGDAAKGLFKSLKNTLKGN